jgi:ubiquinone/menaquinone biosynthesis C-methylase UbiE
MTARQYYQSYIADDSLSELSEMLFIEILKYDPESVFDFGFGSGKHMNYLRSAGVDCIGLDISAMNLVRAYGKYDLPFIAIGNEDFLKYFQNVDVVFTCSVLDHIENIDPIINEFKRIARKAIVLAETNDISGDHYYPHDYESYGFKKTDFSWIGEDGATYHIWVFIKGQNENLNVNDDLGCAV